MFFHVWTGRDKFTFKVTYSNNAATEKEGHPAQNGSEDLSRSQAGSSLENLIERTNFFEKAEEISSANVSVTGLIINYTYLKKLWNIS